jgi:hypothetical protein
MFCGLDGSQDGSQDTISRTPFTSLHAYEERLTYDRGSRGAVLSAVGQPTQKVRPK